MTLSIISPHNVIIHRSNNLRGIHDHIRRTKSKPAATITDQRDGSAAVYLRWPNGDTSHFDFASANLAEKHFATRSSEVIRYAYPV